MKVLAVELYASYSATRRIPVSGGAVNAPPVDERVGARRRLDLERFADDDCVQVAFDNLLDRAFRRGEGIDKQAHPARRDRPLGA
jgi:hypothetical protein